MFYALIAGTIATEPVRRTASNGKPYVTTTVRVQMRKDDVYVSVSAFDDEPRATIAELKSGEAVSVSGPVSQAKWKGRDGEQRSGLQLTAVRILTGKPEPRIPRVTLSPGA